MTKTEWKRTYGTFRRVLKLRRQHTQATTAHRTRPISFKDLRALERAVSSHWRTLCGVWANKGDGHNDGRTHYTWHTACYDDRLWAGDTMPWAQTYSMGSKACPYHQVISTSGKSGGKGSIWFTWRDNYRKLVASGLSPTITTTVDNSLAPVLGGIK